MSGSKRPGGVRGIGTSSEGYNDSPRQKFRKGDRSRRMWTAREEEILATSLVELVARGWKPNNGFHAGHLQKIEDNILKEFPNSDLKGTPHITSKISAWKKSYSSLRGILGRSGVGFNTDGEYKIDCDDEQWEQFVQADKNAKFMRPKSWPFWETWKCIFGKDRATGGGAENVEAEAENMRAQQGAGSRCNENDYHPSLEDFPLDASHATNPGAEQADINDDSSGNEERQTSANKTGTLKCQNVSTDDALMEFLANLHAETNARMEVISSRIEYEFHLGKARQELFGRLGSVEGLALDERYELCDILGDKSQRLEVFMGMPPNARLGYVTRLLKQNRTDN